MKELEMILPQGVRGILAAVSGGADSVAMLALLRDAAQRNSVRLTAAHFEHGIRAESSRADAAFVHDLCVQWGIELIEGSADVPKIAKERSMGLEEAAREERYAFLRRAQKQAQADVIALAHHRNDQAESVLMHLMRGSGLKGLGGMRELDGDLYRPLLKYPKETLVAFLRESGIAWREDETNFYPDNPRNGLRLCVFPQAERFYPGFRQAVCRFSEIAQSENEYMERETDRFLQRNAVRLPSGWLICLNREDMPHRAILMRSIHRLTDLGYDAVCRACELCLEKKGRWELSGTWYAERGKNGLYLSDGTNDGLAEYPLNASGEIDLGDMGKIYTEAGTGIPVRDNPFVQELNADALVGAVVRTRRTGDFIQPLGASGRQKLQDYFVNRHVDRPIRDSTPLIARGSEVLWVMGEGISEQAKLKEGSEAVRVKWTDSPIQKIWRMKK